MKKRRMDMMIREMTVGEFLEALSSKQPTPGGGGAAALAGALGNALGQMVGNLTLGKKKYIGVEARVNAVMQKMEYLQAEFIRLADEDAKVFAPLAAAYGMPADTEEEKEQKAVVLEVHLLSATLAPITVMERAVEMLDVLEFLAENGSRMAVSDVGVGVQFVRTALLGAVMNVMINTKSMRNREKASELNQYAAQLTEKGTKQADEIYRKVMAALLSK